MERLKTILRSNHIRFDLTIMIRNIIIILSFILYSCGGYIHENPNHPHEYLGNWTCDSTSPKGAEMRNFFIMQTGVDITSAIDIHKTISYADWKVDTQQTTFTLLNNNYVEVFAFKIIRKPYMLALKDSTNNVIYYLNN